MDNGYSLSDIGAVTGGGMGYGGGSLWVILILIFLLGGGAWNRGGDGYGQYATAASQQEILFGQQFNRLEAKADSINNGICDATYALNNTIVNEGRQTQAAIGQNRFDLANYFAQLNSNIDNKFAKMELDNEKRYSRSLEGRINQLELNTAMCGVVRYPNGFVYSAGNNPFCGGGNTCC